MGSNRYGLKFVDLWIHKYGGKDGCVLGKKSKVTLSLKNWQIYNFLQVEVEEVELLRVIVCSFRNSLRSFLSLTILG